jgi:hypothetical protein
MSWIALYLPSCDFDPSKGGFRSCRGAKKYVRKTFINRPRSKGAAKYYNTKWAKSVKWCSWIFIEEEKLSKCNDLGNILDNAHGFERIS